MNWAVPGLLFFISVLPIQLTEFMKIAVDWTGSAEPQQPGSQLHHIGFT